jgi:hypothetical protein
MLLTMMKHLLVAYENQNVHDQPTMQRRELILSKQDAMYPSEPVVCGQYGKTNVLDS